MAILDRIKGLFGINWGIPGANTWEFSHNWVRALDTLRNPDTLDSPFAQVGPFQRAVSVISRDAAGVEWEFFNVDAAGNPGDEPVEGHPVTALWRQPNSMMFGSQLMIGSYISYFVFGEWIWYYPDLQVGRRGGFRAAERSLGDLVLLNPLAVIRKRENGAIRYSMRDEQGVERELDAERLTRSARYNPYSDLHGLPLSVAIAQELLGYHAASAWNARFFNEQNGVPTVLLTPSQGTIMSPDKAKQFEERWTQRHGQKRAFGVLPAGWTAEDFGANQRDMDFSALQQFGRDEILAVAGVPPLVAGYLTRSVTYNASEQKELYWESTIHHFLLEQQAAINYDFLPKIGVAERVFPKWEAVQAMLENLTEKTTVAKEWFMMGLSKRVINERLEMGWDPDQIEDYETAYLPMNLTPVDFLTDPPMPPADGNLPPNDGEDDEDSQVDRGYADRGREERRALIWRNIAYAPRDLEREFHRMMRQHYKRIAAEVNDNLSGVRGWRSKWVTKQEDSVVFDVDAAVERLQKRAAPLHEATIKRGAKVLLADLGLEYSFNVEAPRVLALLTQLRFRLDGITRTMAKQMRLSLAEGISNSETIDQLRDRVAAVLDVSLGRARTVASTETGVAFNSGRNEAMVQAGINKQQWLSARDPDVRETHAPGTGVDGEVIEMGETFSNGLRWPQDPSGAPGETINCRCVALPIVE